MTRLWQTNSINSSLLLEKQHSIQYPLSEQFTFGNAEWCEIERVVKSLANNKAPGTDKIPSRVIKDNCLLLNPEKTKLMLFGSRPMDHRLSDFKLSLLGKELMPSESIRDLRVTIDPTLSFNKHISVTVSSCMSRLAQMSWAKHALNFDLLVIIINAPVFSKQYYCSVQSGLTSLPVICKNYNSFRTSQLG